MVIIFILDFITKRNNLKRGQNKICNYLNRIINRFIVKKETLDNIFGISKNHLIKYLLIIIKTNNMI